MGAGVAFIQDPEGARYEEAYPQFKRAYEMSCSINALQNLALCAMKLELDGQAIEYYDIVLAKKTDLAEADRRQIESDLARLKASVSWINFNADRDNVKLVDERVPNRGGVVRNTYDIGTKWKRLGIKPGNHKFAATHEGVTVTWEVEIKSGAQQNHTFKFTGAGPTQPGPGPTPGPQPIDVEPDDGLPVYVWAMVGVTGASAVVMAVFMGVSFSKKGEYDDELHGKVPVNEQQDAIDDIQTFSLVADVFIGVTVAAAATTVVLALLAPKGSSEKVDSEGGPQFGVDYTVVPTVTDQGGGAVFTVSF